MSGNEPEEELDFGRLFQPTQRRAQVGAFDDEAFDRMLGRWHEIGKFIPFGEAG